MKRVKKQQTFQSCPYSHTLNILAVDPATKTGWAISNDVYGTWDIRTRADESWGMKLIRFESKLREIIEKENIELVVYERPAGLYKKAIITQSKLVGSIERIATEKNIDYRAYSATEIKKYATGKGNANKQKMIEAAYEKYNYTGGDDNEADALHLWNLANEEYGN